MAKVTGLEDLLRTLSALPEKIEKNTLRRGARAAANVLKDGARTRVRKQSGLTAEAVKVSTGIRNGVIRAKVQMRGKHSFLGWFLEFGTAPHMITAGGSKDARIAMKIARLGSLQINGKFVGELVFHPGTRPAPFMRPTLDQDRDAAMEAFAAKVRQDIVSRGYDVAYSEREEA